MLSRGCGIWSLRLSRSLHLAPTAGLKQHLLGYHQDPLHFLGVSVTKLSGVSSSGLFLFLGSQGQESIMRDTEDFMLWTETRC